ncbi:MAG: hypothetical protein V2I43_11345 [Parvularcula sp.]|nr:hypothetical protein [Parvularcula sp.]
MTQTVRRQIARPAAQPAVAQPPLVSFLRLAALSCRAAPRGSLRACDLLERSAGPEDFAMALARVLPEAMQRRPVLWQPGEADRSFDETWLLALAEAQARGDAASLRFLTTRRLRPEAAPFVLLLLGGLARGLETARE